MSLKYFGGKYRLAPWICGNLPKHYRYYEPFCGSAAVLLHKARCNHEQINDLYQPIVNYHHWVGSDVVGLIDNINKLKQDYAIALPSLESNTIADAANFYLYSQLSFCGGGTRWNTGASTNKRKIDPRPLIEHSRRLQGVRLSQRNALELIESIAEPDALLYVDPPYLGSVRSSKDNRAKDQEVSMPRRQYAVELMTGTEHRELGDLLLRSPAMVVLSGFQSPLYVELFEAEGWATIGKRASKTQGESDVEILWLNPSAQRHTAQLNLFGAIAS